MDKNAKIFVAGHQGLVGSSLWRALQRRGFTQLIGKTRSELDLLDAKAVNDFFAKEKPVYIFDAAAKVGGIHANDTYPAHFLFENLQIQNNLIHGSDSTENAAFEIKIWFQPEELVDYLSVDMPWIAGE